MVVGDIVDMTLVQYSGESCKDHTNIGITFHYNVRPRATSHVAEF